MDLSVLSTVPVIVLAVVLVILSAGIGHGVGKSRELKRKDAALADAEMARKVALNELRTHQERKLDALVMNNAEQVNQLKQGHAGEIERIGAEHAELVRRLNDSNNANLSALKKEHEGQVTALKERHAAELEALRQAHAEAMRAGEAEHRRAVETLSAGHQAQVQQMRDEYVRLEVERDALAQTAAELTRKVADLHNRIKETRFNNMLSVSKSGEKLIRVVRSVQELATELDETSRAVTDGEYSFLAEIKDMRDRETVLRLAGGGPAHSEASPPTEAPEAGAPVSEDQPAPAGEGEPASEETSREAEAGPGPESLPGGDGDELEGLELPADGPLLADDEVPDNQESPAEDPTQAEGPTERV